MKLPKGSTILELGAGKFTLTREWRRLGYQAWGIDWSMFGCAHDPDMAVRAMVQRLPFKAKSFDAVTAFDILEHVPPEDLTSTVADIGRVTKIWLICNIPLEGPDPDDHHHLAKGDRAFWEGVLSVDFDLEPYNPPNTPGFNNNSTIFVVRARVVEMEQL